MPNSEWVYLELRETILRGDYEPGTRLIEVQVAEQLGVSRTPVREAFKRLLTEELISRDPLGGLVVHAVTPHEVEEAYFVRGGLDGLAARLAATRISPDELTRLQLIYDTMVAAVREGRTDEAAVANVAFHDTIYDIAGNRRLSDTARGLRDFVRRFSAEAFVTVPGRADEVLAEHAQILEALHANDPDAAEAAARAHVTQSRHHLTELRVSTELLSSLRV